MGEKGPERGGREFQGPCAAIISPAVPLPPHLSASAGPRPGCTGWLWQVFVMRHLWLVFGVLPGCTSSGGERFISRWRALARLHLSSLRLPLRDERRGETGRGGIMIHQGCEPRDAEICELLTRVKRTLLTWVPREAVPRG